MAEQPLLNRANLVSAGVFLAHVAAILAGWLDTGTGAVLACTNSYVVRQGFRVRRESGGRRLNFYLTGFFVLFVLFLPVARSPLLFATFGMLYAAVFRTPLLLGCLLILIGSIVFVTPYWIQTTLLLCLLYAVLSPIWPDRTKRFHLFCLVFGFLLVAAVLLPLLYLCFQVTPQTLVTSMGDAVFRRALRTSLLSATISTAVVLVFGVPLAYAIVRLDFVGKGFLESLIDLPIVIPQSVAGIAIMVLLGPKTPLGLWLDQRLGIEVAGSMVGIVLCQVFVSSPFLIRSAANAFRDMGPALENVSRTLGAGPVSTFFRVSLPLASGGIFTGCILCWARAISEVGSLMVIAYHPFTVSVYTYDMFVQYGLKEARPAAVLLVIVCLWGFLLLRWLRTATLGPIFGERRMGR